MFNIYRLIIFDVDGTLVRPKSGKKFRENAEDWEWLPGRKEVIQELRAHNVRVALASNQGGVAFGYMKMEDIRDELHRLAKEAHIPTGGVYICYNHPKATIAEYQADDYRRKPGPGMLLDAISDFECGNDETLYVGDLPEDEQAAKNATVAFQWANEFFQEEDDARTRRNSCNL